MTPKERNQELKQQLVAWQALFDVQESKFPVVMRASVLPALDLDRESETKREREALRTMERVAAICQLLRGKPRGFAKALGIRDELTPTNFSLDGAQVLLERLRELYSSRFEAGDEPRVFPSGRQSVAYK